MKWHRKVPILGSILDDLLPQDSSRRRRYLEREDRARRLKARLLTSLALLSGGAYLIWVYTVLNPEHPVMGALFFGAEAACLLLFLVAGIEVWTLRYKPAQAQAPERPYEVDVFVTACGENADIVNHTLRIAKSIRWPGKLNFYLLDDKGSEEMQWRAIIWGFQYLSRAKDNLDLSDGKAGNLNFGLSNSHGEMVLVLDADQVPEPEILEVLAGYMRFPRVAFVQSKQSFEVPEDDPYYEQNKVFYNVVQLGLDDSNAAISCGSGVLYRRSALEEVRGFSTWNIVEDLTTSYNLHSRGWDSFYVPHTLSRGLAPTTIRGVYQQRSQWTLDTMRLFFWDPPLFKRGLTWRRRLAYSLIGLTYACTAFVFPFFFLVPLWSYLTGEGVLVGSALEFVLMRGLYLLSLSAAMYYLFRAQDSGKQFRVLTGLFPMYAAGIVKALLYPPGRKPPYRPNNAAPREGQEQLKPRPGWSAVLPQAALLTANAVLPFYALVSGTASAAVVATNLPISAFAIWTLWQVVTTAVLREGAGKQPDPSQIYGGPEKVGT